MLHELHGAYVEGQPADHQGECIDIFFGEKGWWKEQFDLDLSEATGDDDETMRMIDLVLVNLDDALAPHIKQMLKDWKEDGF